jgi:dTDP-4-amino-4,6-dideoxygalactose transaminase
MGIAPEEAHDVTAAADTDPVPSLIDRPVRDSHLAFGRPQILEPEIKEVLATLESGWLTTGPRVAAFEAKFRDHLAARHAVAVNSCVSALHLSMIAIGLQHGDEVIVPSMTFAATANAVIHAGGKPVLADVDRRTMCLDPEEVARRITRRTRAVIPVHFAGRACNMSALLALADRHGLRLIEDCAHAVETLYRGRQAGTLGDLGTFSFHATKNLVTGEGGMIATDDAAWAARMRVLALHGLSIHAWKRSADQELKQYEIVEPGFKYNMMDLQAALGLHQLERLEANLERRSRIWARYDQALADLPVWLPPPRRKAPGTAVISTPCCWTSTGCASAGTKSGQRSTASGSARASTIGLCTCTSTTARRSDIAQTTWRTRRGSRSARSRCRCRRD